MIETIDLVMTIANFQTGINYQLCYLWPEDIDVLRGHFPGAKT